MMLSDEALAVMYERACTCDDDLRRAKGQSVRRTRCRSCVTILVLLAEITFLKRQLTPEV